MPYFMYFVLHILENRVRVFLKSGGANDVIGAHADDVAARHHLFIPQSSPEKLFIPSYNAAAYSNKINTQLSDTSAEICGIYYPNISYR
jgi:hypothetical protein